jgi:hypothetical protein
MWFGDFGPVLFWILMFMTSLRLYCTIIVDRRTIEQLPYTAQTGMPVSLLKFDGAYIMPDNHSS